MLPIIVLRRFDCVLEPTKDKVLAEHQRLIVAQTPEKAMISLLSKAADPNRSEDERRLLQIQPSDQHRTLGPFVEVKWCFSKKNQIQNARLFGF